MTEMDLEIQELRRELKRVLAENERLKDEVNECWEQIERQRIMIDMLMEVNR